MDTNKYIDSYNRFINKIRKSTAYSVTHDMIRDAILKTGIDPSLPYEEDEIIENVCDIFDEIKKQVPQITLYRVIVADNKDDIDIDNVGIHFCLSEEDINPVEIGLGDTDDGTSWLLKCVVDQSCIDVLQTIAQNMEYPMEREVSLKKNCDVGVLDIIEFTG